MAAAFPRLRSFPATKDKAKATAQAYRIVSDFPLSMSTLDPSPFHRMFIFPLVSCPLRARTM